MSTVVDALDRFFTSAKEPVLFAGAGVSSHAGIPVWQKLLERLMELARSKDALTAAQMGERIRQGNLLLAAEYFFLSDQILEGDKYQMLVSELRDFDDKPLRALAALPFQRWLTTNFDRSLLQALARNRAPIDYRYGDQSFGEALWQTDQYIARIHGAIEAPRSIVLTRTKFDQLVQDQIYRDLLAHVFTRQNVMFLGFSFYDPAIRQVLEQLNRDYGPASLGRHMALVPGNSENEFLQKLTRLNVEIVQYPPDDNHRALWDGINAWTTRPTHLSAAPSFGASKHEEPFATAKRFLAACYARARLDAHIAPLREVIVEGLVAGVLQKHLPKGVPMPQIVSALHRELSISLRDAQNLVEKAIKALRSDNLCRRHSDRQGASIVWTGPKSSEPDLEESIEVLVRSARDRAIVQEGWSTTSDVASALRGFFREVILQRGWDLGAAFAANRPPESVEITEPLRKFSTLLSLGDIARLQRVCESMLMRPSEEEAKVFAELGRVSFALELAIQIPRTSLFHSAVLPERIYFDANVLMPALTRGHPFHDIYRRTIDRLRDAATRASTQVQLLAAQGFLNEIVSHRRLAIRFMQESGDAFIHDVRREVLYHGTANINVFVGAYASWTLREPDLEFSEFLQREAPYANEGELAEWLKARGIVVVRPNELLGPQYAEISLSLQKAYASGLAAGKDLTLIEHDAYQLSGLAKDRANGKRVILVTADKALRELVSRAPFSELGQSMVSHVGLAQLIDLLVGNPGDAGGMTGLMWVAKASDKTEALRAYLTALGLMEYDEALAMEMPNIVERIAEQMNEGLNRARADPDSTDPGKRAEAFRIMGIYEKGFFEEMRKIIQRRQQEKN